MLRHLEGESAKAEVVRLRALIAENAKKAESAPVAVATAEGGEAATTAEAPKRKKLQRKKLLQLKLQRKKLLRKRALGRSL